jgi:Ala-tRNA(Pro) deacylase
MQHWLDYLKSKDIHYSWSMHRPAGTALEIANAQQVPAHEFAKVVVYSCETGFGMAVVPADRLVDLKEVAWLIGVSEIRLATEGELIDLFPDCEPGAMPPFGDEFHMPVLVDRSLAENPSIVFNIGTHRDALRLNFEDYRTAINPLIASITIANAARA